ncbi:hypothetical protein HYFRA_00002855 [Hymenoscyphus fraxineus]|uniref:Uncharacterized protein n=1 Tax=Hymenoscyphus fraxineus TaxID=746836 RepID=A0A9N9PL31_9HELO|nr:hypothetical protein HYFRA_00002855 [Hymenoscyphus fraxineus]
MLLNIFTIATLLSSGIAVATPTPQDPPPPPIGREYQWHISNWSSRCGIIPDVASCNYAFNVTGDEIPGDPKIPKFSAFCDVSVVTLGTSGNMPCKLLDPESYPATIERSVRSMALSPRGPNGGDFALYISYRFRELDNEQARIFNYSSVWDVLPRFDVPTTAVNIE